MTDNLEDDGSKSRKDAHRTDDMVDEEAVVDEHTTVDGGSDVLRVFAEELDRLSEQKAVGANTLGIGVAKRVVMDAKADALQRAAERARNMAKEVESDE